MNAKLSKEDFKKKYPNLYSNLKSVINNVKDKSFLANLMRLYDITLIPNKQKVRNLNKYWKDLLNSGLPQQHPLFGLLIYYLPLCGISIYHYYVDELEEALGNPNILFEKKEQKIRALTRKEEFWDTYFELEVANSLAKEGCRVVVQENINRFDMRVSFNNVNFNTEVTAIRLENRDEKTVCQNITKRIESKAIQLPKKGINVIILSVPLDSKLMPYDIPDALYGGPPVVKIIRSASIKKSFTRKVKSPLILETNSKLSNIAAVVHWAHRGIPLGIFGKQARLIYPYSRRGFPQEIRDILININRQTR